MSRFVGEHPRAIAAKLCHSPKLAARASGLTANECRAIRDLRLARMARLKADPLILAQARRRWERSAEARRLAAEFAHRRSNAETEAARVETRERRKAAIRESLLTGAREARKLGWEVRGSKDRTSRVSSYYVRPPGGSEIRVSDHEIPETPQRAVMAEAHGRSFYDGYHGAQLLITEPRTATWLRRSLILIAAGRRS